MKCKSKQEQRLDLAEKVQIRVPSDYGWRILSALVEDVCHLLTADEVKILHKVIRSRDYNAYSSLCESWGPQSTYLDGKTPAEMRACYQVISLLKKFRFPSDNATRRLSAIDKFKAAETSCSEFNQFGYLRLANITGDDRMLRAFTYSLAFLRKLLGVYLPDIETLTEFARHGPGANLDTLDGNTSLYSKYSEWPYSCTSLALADARSAIQQDERWLGALEDSYRERFNIPKTLILDQEVFWAAVLTPVDSNRITFVPKNAQTDRSIAIEPSLNLYLQLGVDGFIRRRLKRWGVDIDSQTKNRDLAREGSVHYQEEVNFVTLDLAAASDSISTELCRLLLPSPWYSYLMTLRSPSGVLDGETIHYEKISSMGNGFTFALETAIFTAIVYGVSKEFRGCYQREFCAIYGDDIIVTSDIAPQVVALLNLCGFKVNDEKSFFKGPFRESCGADWFMGYPVRPVYLVTPPTTVMELWTDHNRLRRTLSLRFMGVETRVESILIRWIPDEFRNITGPDSDTDFDSYKHSSTPANAVYNFCLWKYKRLVVRPRPVSGPSFFFRKLMHDLRGQVAPVHKYADFRTTWKGCKLTGSGSRFTVTRPGLVSVGYSYSVSDIWRQGYGEV